MTQKNIIFLSFAVLLICACKNNSTNSPAISVENVWSRPVHASVDSAGNASTIGVIYLTIHNDGAGADRLIACETQVCNVVEIHESKMADGQMSMQMLKDGLEVPAKSKVELKPGGFHIMLIGMKRNLQPGDTFEVELSFEKAGKMTVQSKVEMP